MIWASTNGGTDVGLIPAKVSLNIRATVAARLANDADEVNQYAAPIQAATEAAESGAAGAGERDDHGDESGGGDDLADPQAKTPTDTVGPCTRARPNITSASIAAAIPPATCAAV